MTLDDETKRSIRAALEQMPDSVLTVTQQSAERLARDLDSTNSIFPATQEFLRSRGLTKVSQLGPVGSEGRNALTAHLEHTLRLRQN